jgi:hypothetical protein
LTHTAGAGNDRLLVFMVAYENASDVAISTVKYGGQSLTRINGTAVGSTVVRGELWYLKEAGIVAATNTTFVITYGGTAPTEITYAAATYRNINQTSPVVASTVNSANGASPNPLTAAVSVTADGMAVAGALCGNTSTFTWNNGWTEGVDQSAASSASSTADHTVAANGTDTASTTNTNQNREVIVAVSLSVSPP